MGMMIVVPIHVSNLPLGIVPVSIEAFSGILLAVFSFSNLFMLPIAAALVDRTKRSKMLIQIGISIQVIGTVALLLSDSPIEMAMFQVLRGIGFSLTIPATFVFVAGVSAGGGRGGALGIYFTGRSLGFGIGPMLAGYLLDTFSLRITYIAFSVLGTIGIVLITLFFDDSESRVSKRPAMPFKLLDRNVLNGNILVLGLAMTMMYIGMFQMVPLINQFSVRLQQSTLEFGVALGVLFWTQLIFQFPFGTLSDRIGRKPFIVAGLGLTALITGLQGFVGTVYQLVGLRALQGVVKAAVHAPVFALAADLSHEGMEGRQITLLNIGIDTGISIGPLMSGYLVAHFFELPFLVGGLLSIVGVFIVVLFVSDVGTQKVNRIL